MKKTIFFLILLMIFCTSSSFLIAQELLEVEGAIQIKHTTNPTPVEGTIRWNGEDFEGWDGQEWISLTTGRTISDVQGNIYRVAKIGTQYWMADNLKTEKYANDDFIPDGTGLGDISANPTPNFFFYYDDDIDNVTRYGRLYTWYAATDNRNICPTGWHVPSEAEFNTLITYLGGATLAGGKMKIEGTGRWNSDKGDNTSEFSALPGGRRTPTGMFVADGAAGYYWSTSEQSPSVGKNLELLGGFENANILPVLSKKDGHSVRCIRD